MSIYIWISIYIAVSLSLAGKTLWLCRHEDGATRLMQATTAAVWWPVLLVLLVLAAFVAWTERNQ